MDRKFVRPGVGPDGAPFVTRHPVTKRPLSPDGEWVDCDSTTRRRLREGDWVEAEPPAPEAPPEPAPEPLAQGEKA